MDLEILAALSNRDAWEKYHRFVRLSSLTEESANIFQAMGDWYTNNPKVANVSWKPFASWFALVRHAKMDPEKLRLHKLLLNKLETEKFDEDDIRPLTHSRASRSRARARGSKPSSCATARTVARGRTRSSGARAANARRRSAV